MVKLLNFKRSSKKEKNVLELNQKEDRDLSRKHDIDRRARYVRHSEKLKKMNVSLLGKMEDLRMLPLSAKEDGIGSFFCDELEFLKTIHNSPIFYDFYTEIIDVSQTLALVIVNKEFIITKLLEAANKPYFKNFMGKLIVSFLRDCGSEVYFIFQDKIIPRLAEVIDIKDFIILEMVFTILAGGLKFILKDCLLNFFTLSKSFLTHFVPKSNPFIRRYSTECLVYLIRKVRKTHSLRKNLVHLFTLSIQDLNLSSTKLDSDKLGDYLGSLIYEILRGDQGYINEQIREVVPVFSALFERGRADTIVKAINLLIENEFRFYRKRQYHKEKELKGLKDSATHGSKSLKKSMNYGYRYELQDFLNDLQEQRIGEGQTLKKMMLPILTNIIMFNNGQRFNSAFEKLAKSCLEGNEISNDGLTFIAKYILIKKTPLKALNVMIEKEMSLENIYNFFNHLENYHSIGRTEVRKGFKQEIKKQNYTLVSEFEITENCFDFIAVIAAKFITSNLQEQIHTAKFSNFLGLFLCLCQKYYSNRVFNLDQSTIQVIESLLSKKSSQKMSSWNQLVLLRLLRFTDISKRVKHIKTLIVDFIKTKKISEWTTNQESDQNSMNDNPVSSKIFYSEEELSQYRVVTKTYNMTSTLDEATYLLTECCEILLKMKLQLEHIDLIIQLIDSLLQPSNYSIHLLNLLKDVYNYMKRPKNRSVFQEKYLSNKGLKQFKFSESILNKLVRGLQTSHPISRKIIIDLIFVSQADYNSRILNQISLINDFEANFQHERGICMELDNLSRLMLKEDISEQDAALITFFGIAMTSIRLSTPQKQLKNMFNKLAMLKASTIFPILFNSVVTRNLFDNTTVLLTQDVNNSICLINGQDEGDMVQEENTEDHIKTQKIFRRSFDRFFNPVETFTQLQRLMDMMGGVVNAGFIDQGNNKKDMEQEETTHSENNNEDQETVTKKERQEEFTANYLHFYEFFVNFLDKEMALYILPNLRFTLKQAQYQSVTNTNLQVKEDPINATPDNLDQYFDELLKNGNKRNKGNDYYQITTSRVIRLKQFIKVFNQMKKLSSCEFSKNLYFLLLEVIKYPDADFQISTLACIKKTGKGGQIIEQYYGLLSLLVKRESFKANLLTLNQKVKDFNEMEKNAVMPVANALLFRKLLDKKGTGNFRNFNSIREFVLQTVKNFREEDINNLFRTIFSSFNCSIEDPSTVDVKSNILRMPITKIIGLLELCNNLIRKMGRQIVNFLPLIQEFILQGLEISNEFKVRFKDTKKNMMERLKNQEQKQKEKEEEEAEEDDEEENEDDIEDGDQEEKDGEEEEEEKAEEEAEEQGITDRERSILSLERSFKSLRQVAMSRVTSIFSHYLDQDLLPFARRFIQTSQRQIESLDKGTYRKIPQLLRTIGCWVEGEAYKIFFLEFDEILPRLFGLLSNSGLTINVFTEVQSLIQKLTKYDVSQESETQINLHEKLSSYLGEDNSLVSELQGHQFSTIGLKLMNKYLPNILDNLEILFQNMDSKKIRGMKRSEIKNLNKLTVDLCIHISFFCNTQETSDKLYSILSRFWDVKQFNKLTDKSKGQLRTANELKTLLEYESLQKSHLGLMTNLAPKLSQFEHFYETIFLKMISGLGNLRLRQYYKEILIACSRNPKFKNYGIEVEFLNEISEFFELSRILSANSLKFNEILKFLIDHYNNLESLNTHSKRLLIACCVSWARDEELGIRSKAVELLEKYISEIDSEDEAKYYNTVVLPFTIRFFTAHRGREGQIKSALAILRANIDIAKKYEGIVNIPYGDLECLRSPDVEQDFFDLVLNLKLQKRGKGVRTVEKLIAKGTKFTPTTIKTFFKGLLEYFIFDYWNITTSSSKSYSNERIDRVREILLVTFRIYGQLIGMLSLPQYIRTIRDLVMMMGTARKSNDQILKIVCSCLDNMNEDIHDILNVINTDHEQRHLQGVQSSYLNKVISVYNNAREVEKARAYAEFNTEEIKATPAQIEKLNSGNMDIEEEGEEENNSATQLRTTQIESLKKGILGPLKRNMTGKDENTGEQVVKPEVAIAVVKLIRKFPIETFNSELIGTVHKICKCLKAKDLKLRDVARNTLCKLIRELGPFFLGMLVKEVAFHCNRGFEIHVRNFTVYKLIEELMPLNPKVSATPIKPGKIDYCVKDIAELFIEEVVGQLAKEKEAAEVRTRSKEFLKSKGAESFRLLATKIDFTSDAVRYSKLNLKLKYSFLTIA